ncbi:hypothetical protein [Pseudomonas sp. PSKL.D1]|uniref:hypothetical protein n=1 Tax=Pseudomonas sp. PSKL.D1 TaxID=3029060 RepID=UPI00238165EA|nr:hypothetical protein [Pseudomonas sp. PSKL.D1]WDY57965.1 hypothetical protein PVV54_25960 [Pseudomonas sp. PSKL.D1]
MTMSLIEEMKKKVMAQAAEKAKAQELLLKKVQEMTGIQIGLPFQEGIKAEILKATGLPAIKVCDIKPGEERDDRIAIETDAKGLITRLMMR